MEARTQGLYKPAPKTKIKALDATEVEKAIEDFKRQVRQDPPLDQDELDERLLDLGSQWDLWNNVATLGGSGLLGGPLGKLRSSLERVGSAFTVLSLVEAQAQGGGAAGVQLLYESAKFLSGKVARVSWLALGSAQTQGEGPLPRDRAKSRPRQRQVALALKGVHRYLLILLRTRIRYSAYVA